MKKGAVLLLFFLVALLIPSGLAQETYDITLLAVSGDEGNFTGSTATIELELREGSGRVFLETQPAAKLDTQISTRFAKEIACNHFNLNCNEHDFIYTIRSGSSIIGGPSAGAAIAALTTIAVLDLPYENNVAITGTINSGATIGPVGGVPEKVEAAAKDGIKTILVAPGALTASNQSKNITTIARENRVEVREVATLTQVLEAFTGKTLTKEITQFEVNNEYNELMQQVESHLCNRTTQLLNFNATQLNGTDPISLRLDDAQIARENQDHYSAASLCFTSNIELKQNYYQEKNYSEEQILLGLAKMDNRVNSLKERVEKRKITSIAHLQTQLIVLERLSDAQDQSRRARENVTIEQQRNILAYIEERYSSALFWTGFFEMSGATIKVDEQVLENACEQKIEEAQERYQYANLYLNEFLISGINSEIERAQKEKANPLLCLGIASQAKAQANAVLSSLGVTQEQLDLYIDQKENAARSVIAKQIAEENFPILGYSYYQYANTLREDQPSTALLYYEFALELGDLSIYFPAQEKRQAITQNVDEKWIFFILGFATASILLVLLRKKD